ncbi:MAG: class I SAM-dependent methyltransferase [Candidatus Wallbacteria bacterium]|nr:class I SAM-dependent methyltransferase [Candidatus Wallbacteria bacterium]
MAANRTDLAASLAGSGRRLLDVGCGDGHFLSLVAPRYSELHGAELDAERAARCRARGAFVTRVDLDATGLPYAAGAFDSATMLDVLEHVREPLPALREVHRVLAPGGRVFVSTPNIRYWKHLVSILFQGRFPSTSDDPSAYDGGHLHYFTFADVEALMRQAGFTDFQRVPVLDPDKFRRWSRLATGHLLREFLSGGVLIAARKPGAAG